MSPEFARGDRRPEAAVNEPNTMSKGVVGKNLVERRGISQRRPLQITTTATSHDNMVLEEISEDKGQKDE